MSLRHPHGGPADWVGQAAERFGRANVARRCASLLLGERDPQLLPYLAGRALRLADGGVDYWPRVWAARGLRYAWDDGAAPAVLAALTDSAWRVREMAAKLVRRYELGDGAEALAVLASDPVARVRAAAAAALGQVGEVEHAGVLRDLTRDSEPLVRRSAAGALRTLGRRLDREL